MSCYTVIPLYETWGVCSYQVLIPICQKLVLSLVISIQLLIKDSKSLNCGVVHNTRSFPCNKKTSIILWIRLNIFRFWAANWKKEKRKEYGVYQTVQVSNNKNLEIPPENTNESLFVCLNSSFLLKYLKCHAIINRTRF